MVLEKLAKMKFSSLLLLIIFLKINIVFSQKEEEIEIIIENADTIILAKDLHTNLYNQILVGNVFLTYEGTKMFCDSAVKYGDNNTIEAFYDVEILQGDSIHLKSHYLKFSNLTQQTLAKDSVSLRHNEATLFTDFITYYLNTNIAKFKDTGRIVDLQNKILSERGIYQLNQNMVTFYNLSLIHI